MTTVHCVLCQQGPLVQFVCTQACTTSLGICLKSTGLTSLIVITGRTTSCSRHENDSSHFCFAAAGAHTQDLEPIDPADDPSANEARRQGLQNIISWIADYNEAIATVPTSNGADLFDLNFALGGYLSVWNDTVPGSNTSRSTASLNSTASLSNAAI